MEEDDDVLESCVVDDGDHDLSECGMMDDGTCTKAGSEECDWDCPLQLEEYGEFADD